MNKSDLVNEVSTITGLTKTKSSETIDAIVSVIEKSLSNGEKVNLVGFGSWETTQRAERVARNPKTGEEVKVPAKTVARFKPGSNLNKQING
jgi:DNA-binding protein HU-beta